jgi:hypothetical protein
MLGVMVRRNSQNGENVGIFTESAKIVAFLDCLVVRRCTVISQELCFHVDESVLHVTTVGGEECNRTNMIPSPLPGREGGLRAALSAAGAGEGSLPT